MKNFFRGLIIGFEVGSGGAPFLKLPYLREFLNFDSKLDNFLIPILIFFGNRQKPFTCAKSMLRSKI